MMTELDRKAELVRRGVKVRHLAERAGVSEQMIRQVLRGREKSRRIRVLIARTIGKSVADVFPA